MKRLGLLLTVGLLSGCGATGLSLPFAPGATGALDARSVSRHTLDHMPFPLLDTLKNASASDPINVLVVGKEGKVNKLMLEQGWAIADPLTVVSAAHFVEAYLFHRPYPSAPVSTQYYFGREQDRAYEKCDYVNVRDHFRLWKSDLKSAAGDPVWCLACTRDAGIGRFPGHLLPGHILDPDADAERDRVVADLTRTDEVAASYSLVGLGAHFTLVNGYGNTWFTNDGLIQVVELKPD